MILNTSPCTMTDGPDYYVPRQWVVSVCVSAKMEAALLALDGRDLDAEPLTLDELHAIGAHTLTVALRDAIVAAVASE